MSFKDQDLEQIAYLGRINIDKNYFPSLKRELESILDLVTKINSADTESVEPMSHPLDLFQPLRKDEVTEKDERENLQKNAKNLVASVEHRPGKVIGRISSLMGVRSLVDHNREFHVVSLKPDMGR